MRILSMFAAGVALAIVTGCTTQKRVTTLEGRGTKQIYTASFDQAWRAAVDASQRDLEIVSSDRSRGYIGARRTLRPHTFGENVGIWIREIAPAQTEVEVVSRQAGPPVASWRNWENEIQRAIAANLTRDAVGGAPRTTIIERGGSSTIVVPESSRETIVPESRSRETIIVPEPRETIVVPETSATRAALRDEERRLEDLRTKREAGERALAKEVDETKREMLQREIDRLREDLQVQQRRLKELEQQVK
jgi:hypothetical protein